MEEIVRDYGLEAHLRLGTEAESARFDESSGRWTLRTTDGEEREFDVLVTACGQLTNPAIPRSGAPTTSPGPASTRRSGTTNTTSAASGWR